MMVNNHTRGPNRQKFADGWLLWIRTTAMVAGLAWTSAIAPRPATAAGFTSDFSQVYAFGDSLVDTGNVFELTGIPPAPYAEGRFSNGPLWIEYLADDLNVPFVSLGISGARTGTSGKFAIPPVDVPVPGTQTQISQLIQQQPELDSDGLYVIWAGANDYLSGEQTSPVVPVTNLAEAVRSLDGAGAENILLVNLPDLGALPRLATAPTAARTALSQLTSAHNAALSNSIEALQPTLDASVEIVDAATLFDAAASGDFPDIADAQNACLSVATCVADPVAQTGFLFWDEIHPTTAAHRLIADEALVLLQPADSAQVPEPGMILGLVIVGGAMAQPLYRRMALKDR